jgi:hypothetical protein
MEKKLEKKVDLENNNREPQMGSIGRIIRSKKGNYFYIITDQMEGNVRIKWINQDGSKTPYSYSRVIRINQIGGRDYEEVSLEEKKS